MAHKKVTETAVAKMTEDLSDTEISGFRVRQRKSGKFFYFQYRINNQRKSYAIGKHGTITVEHARQVARKLAGQVALGIDPLAEKESFKRDEERQKQSTMRSFLENGFKDVATPSNYSYVKARLEKHFPTWLDKQLTDISPWLIEKWIRTYTGAPSGCNRILTGLRGFFSKAVKAGLIDASPMPQVKKVKEDKNKKTRYLSIEEERALLAALERRQQKMREERDRFITWCNERNQEPPERHSGPFTDHLKPMVLLALYAGLRRGEIFNLRVSDLDLPERILTVAGEGAKSGQTRQIPINDPLFATLVGWLNQTGNKGLVFPSPKTGSRFDNIKKSWVQLCEEAELTGFRFHDLRHTFATRLVHARVDLESLRELMGHESLTTTARYLHTSMDRKQEAVSILGAI